MTQQATATKTYRVVQWATGNVGSRALRRTIEHSELDRVGVYVHSAEKEGRDAGELCGVEPVGVMCRVEWHSVTPGQRRVRVEGEVLEEGLYEADPAKDKMMKVHETRK